MSETKSIETSESRKAFTKLSTGAFLVAIAWALLNSFTIIALVALYGLVTMRRWGLYIFYALSALWIALGALGAVALLVGALAPISTESAPLAASIISTVGGLFTVLGLFHLLATVYFYRKRTLFR